MGRATIIDMTDTPTSRHVVAVVGAATAGSEIAHILAQRDALVVVIEQNPRPYGKIEDGLPRWHVKQRKDEYEEINQRLDSIMIDSFIDTIRYAETHHVNNRIAAYMLAIDRVAYTTKQRGIYA